MNVLMALRAGRLDLDRDRMELSVTHAWLCHHGLRKMHHGLRRSAQDHGLDAIVVVEVGMHGGHGYIVMIVLHAGQSAGELPLVVVVDVTQRADAMLGDAFTNARIPERTAHQVTEGL